MRYYTGPKPCPGCSRSGKEEPRGAVDELCHDCKKLIELGKGVMAEKPDDYSSVTMQPYSFGPLEYSVDSEKPNYRGGRDYFKTEHPVYVTDDNFGSKKKNANDNIPGSSRDLLDKFQALLKSIDQGKKASENLKYHMRGKDCFYGRDTVYLHTDTALAVFNLVDAMARWSNRIQKQAYSEGKDLLFGLASGDMTVKEFNERSARFDKD